MSFDRPDAHGEGRSSSNEIVAISSDAEEDDDGEAACDTAEDGQDQELLSAPSFPRSFGLNNSLRSINHTLETSTEVANLGFDLFF